MPNVLTLNSMLLELRKRRDVWILRKGFYKGEDEKRWFASIRYYHTRWFDVFGHFFFKGAGGRIRV